MSQTSEEQLKIQKRKARFGDSIDSERLKKRAARFDTYHPDLESQKAEQRAARFMGKPTEDEKAKRIEKFRCPEDKLEDVKRQQRASRFAKKEIIEKAPRDGPSTEMK